MDQGSASSLQTQVSGKVPMSRRRFLGVAGGIAAAAAASPLLAACSSSGTKASGGSTAKKSSSDTITIMTTAVPADATLALWNELAAKPAGLTLKFVTVADATFPSQAVAAQQAGDVPDVIQWSSQGAAVLKASGVQLAQLDSYISGSENKADFYPQDYESGTIDGQIYCVGFNCDSRALAYRGDYAAAAGPVPAQWSADEFGAWASKVKVPSGGNVFGWEAKVGDGRGSSNFLPLLWSTGAALVTKQGGQWATGFSQDQFEQVMQFYHDCVYKWKITPKQVAGWGYPDTDGGFSKGTLAAYSVGPFIEGICAAFPTTLKNIKAGPLPNLGTPASFWSESGMMVHAQSNNKDKAWQFITNLRGQKAQDALTGMTGNTEASPRISSNSKLGDATLQFFANYLKVAKVPEALDIHVIMDNVVYPAMEEITLNGTDPKSVAASAMTSMTSALSQING